MNEFIPPAVYWSPMRVGDVRIRSGSFAAVLQPRSLIIQSINSVTITRADEQSMGSGDLAVIGTPSLDSTSLIVSFVLTGGNAGVTYDVAISVAVADGETYIRDAFQLVTEPVS